VVLRVLGWALALALLAGVAAGAYYLFILPKPTLATPPPQARSPYLLPDVRPWPNGVVPVCWIGRPDRGSASVDDLRMMLAVKMAEETWAGSGAVKFKDVGLCPAGPFHGAKFAIDRSIDDPDSPALGAALGDQAQPVNLPFAFPSRSDCSRGKFGGTDTCTYGEAVHEIGHVLGLPDLHYSVSAPPECKATLRGDHPPETIPYDADSVMNACNPNHYAGALSAGDRAAIQQIYGG
jgi:hypothetical protein